MDYIIHNPLPAGFHWEVAVVIGGRERNGVSFLFSAWAMFLVVNQSFHKCNCSSYATPPPQLGFSLDPSVSK